MYWNSVPETKLDIVIIIWYNEYPRLWDSRFTNILLFNAFGPVLHLCI